MLLYIDRTICTDSLTHLDVKLKVSFHSAADDAENDKTTDQNLIPDRSLTMTFFYLLLYTLIFTAESGQQRTVFYNC